MAAVSSVDAAQCCIGRIWKRSNDMILCMTVKSVLTVDREKINTVWGPSGSF
jgi:hypothetical protein